MVALALPLRAALAVPGARQVSITERLTRCAIAIDRTVTAAWPTKTLVTDARTRL
eukprot:COSAG02_NODE_3019_length_7535_cov_9.178456_4_plen_55_part_00